MQRRAVLVGVDGDGFDAEVLCRPDNPNRNLAAVGNQNLGNASLGHNSIAYCGKRA